MESDANFQYKKKIEEFTNGPSERSRSGSMKKLKTSPAAPMAMLSDDLLGGFLMRLPDLPSLASAALVSKRWRRVACDPAILRHFNLLRRPPLLGVIFSDRGDTHIPRRCPNLRFVPSHTGNPRLVAAAKAGDFLFADLPDDYWKRNGGGQNRRNDDKWRLRQRPPPPPLPRRGFLRSRRLRPLRADRRLLPPPPQDALRK
jgi:hypothetical protein